MSARTAASKAVDWTKVTTKLGLGQNTLSSLSAFRKRNTDARDKVNQLESQRQTVDFDFYRSVLKNQAIVKEVEQSFKSFKPKTYDVSAQIKAIEQFEAKAVEGAQQTEKSIDKELSDLQETLKNIESARPFEELTVEDVMRARPDIAKNVETMVTKGSVMQSAGRESFTDIEPQTMGRSRIHRQVWQPGHHVDGPNNLWAGTGIQRDRTLKIPCVHERGVSSSGRLLFTIELRIVSEEAIAKGDAARQVVA